MSINQSQHNHVDGALEIVTALPAAGANVTSSSIDTKGGTTTVYPAGATGISLIGNAALHESEVRVGVLSTVPLNSGYTITFTLQASDDNSTWAAIAGIATQTITGNASNVVGTTEVRWMLPSGCARYIVVNAAVQSGGGTLTAYNFTLDLLT